MWSWALTGHDAPASWGPMCRILYRLLVSLACLAVRSGRSKDLEVIVLRHQLTVLHRLNNRPAIAEEDRALLGAVAAALLRSQRAGWLVTPETLLRWHRQRIARHWTRPRRTLGAGTAGKAFGCPGPTTRRRSSDPRSPLGLSASRSQPTPRHVRCVENGPSPLRAGSRPCIRTGFHHPPRRTDEQPRTSP